jgi:hypothetical protein
LRGFSLNFDSSPLIFSPIPTALFMKPYGARVSVSLSSEAMGKEKISLFWSINAGMILAQSNGFCLRFLLFEIVTENGQGGLSQN